MKPLTLCKRTPGQAARDVKYGPFEPGDILVFLGEITNMPGHGVYAVHVTDDPMRMGYVYTGYHIDEFIELRDEEI